jgi:type III restriction enzyme
MTEFARSAHPRYPDAPSYLNNDEKEMAQALDGFAAGWRMRNPPTRASGGYGLPMPVQVAGSQTFYPDFLWWIDERVFAIDATGVHILGPKVRGKLFSLPLPHVALATRGRVTADLETVEDRPDGHWSYPARPARCARTTPTRPAS